MKVVVPSMKIVLTLLFNSVSIPLGLTAAASATDSAIQKTIYGLGMTILIISNKVIKDIMKIAKSLEESGLLTKGVNKAIENEKKKKKKKKKEQKVRLFGMLISILSASLLANMLILFMLSSSSFDKFWNTWILTKRT